MGAELTAKDLAPTSNNPHGTIGYSSRCRLCNSSKEILLVANRELINGAGYSEVARVIRPLVNAIPGLKTIGPDIVKRHYQDHFNVHNKAIREVILRRTQEIEDIAEEGSRRILDAVAVAELFMVKGTQQALEPGAVITPGETLAAAKLHREMTKDENSQIELSMLQQQMADIIDAIQEVCTEDQQRLIVAIAEQKNRAALAAATYQEEDIEDAEIINSAILNATD